MKFLSRWALAALVPSVLAPAALAQPDPMTASQDSWERAQAEAVRRQAVEVRPQQARNVILFIADGMSIPTISAGRIFLGEHTGAGESQTYVFEGFDQTALVRTYNTDAQVADSASTATALVTGFKTRTGAVSVLASQGFEACAPGARFPSSLAELAERRGLATGVVSTARLTHATPATMYAHSLSRNWESDADLPEMARDAGCQDIASQLIAFAEGDGIEVAMGGGRRNFLPDGAGGEREDGRDLTAEWSGIVVQDRTALMAVAADDDAPVLGLFNDDHMSYEADRAATDEPSLAEMTRFAIDRLSRNPDGYVLMVEAGRVDHAHHITNAYRALTDMEAFNAAITTALDHVDLDETLVIITADHGHTMTFAGYPARGNPILGLVRRSNPFRPGSEPELTLDVTGRPYTTLGYRNGSNVRTPDSPALDEADTVHPDYRQEVLVGLEDETHSGADVALYATGPRSHWFSGSLEQNTIFHLIQGALGWQRDAGDSGESSQE
nr:alkaline phosphatase [Maricaulis parjimensis]